MSSRRRLRGAPGAAHGSSWDTGRWSAFSALFLLLFAAGAAGAAGGGSSGSGSGVAGHLCRNGPTVQAYSTLTTLWCPTHTLILQQVCLLLPTVSFHARHVCQRVQKGSKKRQRSVDKEEGQRKKSTPTIIFEKRLKAKLRIQTHQGRDLAKLIQQFMQVQGKSSINARNLFAVLLAVASQVDTERDITSKKDNQSTNGRSGTAKGTIYQDIVLQNHKIEPRHFASPGPRPPPKAQIPTKKAV